MYTFLQGFFKMSVIILNNYKILYLHNILTIKHYIIILILLLLLSSVKMAPNQVLQNKSLIFYYTSEHF